MTNINQTEKAPKINDELEEVTAESLERQVNGGDGLNRGQINHDKRRQAVRNSADDGGW